MKRTSRFLLMLAFTATQANPLFAQWVQTDGPYDANVSALAVSPNGAGGTNLFAGTTAGMFLSTNNGTSWTAADSGLIRPSLYVFCFAVSDTLVFAGTNGGLYLSTNNGTSWTALLTGTSVDAFAITGKNVFAGTLNGLFLSTDNGAHWSWLNTGLGNANVGSLAISDTNLFAEGIEGLFLSTNSGMSWIGVNSGLGQNTVSSLTVSDTNLFAVTNAGVFLSTNNGTSWTAADSGLTSTSVTCLAVSGTNLFAGTSAGVFLSTNNGTSWTEVNSGLTNVGVLSLAISGTNLFAGTSGGGVWWRPLSQMVTSVVNRSSDVPAMFSLSQNYPNPFNPTTTISYQLPSNAFVVLKVFDILGREVQVLVNQREIAGVHSVTFNASNLPSGVYFYRLEAGTYHDTKKLLLLK